MSRSKRKIYALDCETDPFKDGRIPQPFIWGLYDGEHFEHFSTAAEVVARLERENCVVYAHNGGKFDYHYLREHINSDEPLMLIGGRLAKFRIGEAEFRDSMNLFTFPLSAYQKDSIDYALMEADRRDDPNVRAEIIKYLRSDCVNLWELLDAFFKEYGKNLTQAGAAMRVWSKMSGMKPPQSTAQEYADYKPYYYGGRVQCFEHGHGLTDFSVMDINSAYPHVMLSDHPFCCRGSIEPHLPHESEWARCFLTIDGVSKGALPWIEESKRGNKLIFPCDENTIRTYHITGHELQAAIDTDSFKIFRVRDVWRFPIVANFREYVERFYALRKVAKANGDKAQDLFAKIFLNALYGKFGANPSKYMEYRLTHLESLGRYSAEDWIESCQWGERFLLQRKIDDDKQRYYNIATAASITGAVRANLWRAICQCSGVLYCDTDSIAARDVSRLETGAALGQWKTEMLCKEYAIAGKKNYAFRASDEWSASNPGKEWKIASKGTRLTAAQMIAVARGAAVQYRTDVPTYSARKSEIVFTHRTVRATA